MAPLERREFMNRLGGAALAGPLVTTLAGAGLGDDAPRAQRIKVGQIGVGHAHAGKLAVYRRSPDYEVVGIVEPDPELRQWAETQSTYRDLPWMTQEQLLNVSGLQAVLVETRVRDLLRVAEACVAAGKHIHLDKPAGESLPQFQRLLEAAAKQKLLVQLGYMYRYNPAVVLLREFLKKGWLGAPFEVHAVMSKVVPPEGRQQLAPYRGGMMFELGCHLIDLVVAVLGKPREIAVFAHHASRLEDALLDNMLAVFTYPRATASIRSSALEVEGFERRHLVVCGTEGTFHIQPLDNPSARIALSTMRAGYRKGYQDLRFPKYTRYIDDAADMAKIIRGEKATDFPYEHDFHVQGSLLKACGLPLTE